MLATLATRGDLDVNVLRDRNPLFVRLSDGSIRNGYTVKILNKRHDEERFTIAVEGISDPSLSIVGAPEGGLVVGPDSLRSYRIYVAAPRQKSDTVPIRFVIGRGSEGRVAVHDTTFRGPER